MGKDRNKQKSEQLGMAHGTAANRLRKLLLFDLAVKSGLGDCFRCGKSIEMARDLSIEHKISWLNSEDPVGLFFDLDNIAFSHLSCNSRYGAEKGAATEGWKRRGTGDPEKMVYYEPERYPKRPWSAKYGKNVLRLGRFVTREEAVQARTEHLEKMARLRE